MSKDKQLMLLIAAGGIAILLLFWAVGGFSGRPQGCNAIVLHGRPYYPVDCMVQTR